ncbi:hypothetical protein L798_11216 [Zootermopsis nevadensis]|uniref:Uncharacterized protein n=1 Tax=Zootermopsis nevadensis TaxID=136037 RepID=A0A067R6R4_ZOONE|nr:hypothetical protein L798_11216 [Zootermopsis nevadensis]
MADFETKHGILRSFVSTGYEALSLNIPGGRGGCGRSYKGTDGRLLLSVGSTDSVIKKIWWKKVRMRPTRSQWDEADFLQVKWNFAPGKYKRAAHIARVKIP